METIKKNLAGNSLVQEMEALRKNHGYNLTDAYNGEICMHRRQVLKIIKTAKVPADWNGCREISGKVLLQGVRGALYIGYLKNNMSITAIRGGC